MQKKVNLIKECKKIVFIIEKIKKYLKCPALCSGMECNGMYQLCIFYEVFLLTFVSSPFFCNKSIWQEGKFVRIF